VREVINRIVERVTLQFQVGERGREVVKGLIEAR